MITDATLIAAGLLAFAERALAAEAAVERVRKLHTECGHPISVCHQCQVRQPCPTIRALDGARPALIYQMSETRTVLPSVGDVADAIHASFDLDTPDDDEPCYCDLDTLNEAAKAVLSLLPGRTEAEIKAEAWDEGWAARADRKHLKVGECVPAPPHINPYRRSNRVEAGR
jgi:hypothetical protein